MPTMLSCLKLALLLATVISVVRAATCFTDEQMNAYLADKAIDLAYNYAPIWFFSEAENSVSCYPDWAFSGSPTTPDVYDAAHLTAPAPQCEYPDVGCSCRHPDVPKGNPGPAFPIYYTYERCSATEVRVAYNVFYQKDGANFGSLATGHNFDWERIIVVHTQCHDNIWMPTMALYSAHSGYHNLTWSTINGTLSQADAEAGKGPAPAGLQDLDHPKAYVSWSKHAHFDTTNPSINPNLTLPFQVLAQSTDAAYRGDDWWRFVDKKDYILADLSTAAGQIMNVTEWGGATSDPTYVQARICSEGRGGES